MRGLKTVEIMAASDDRWFTAPTLEVAPAIAGLARHGINNLVQAAFAHPTTQFCFNLSVSSP